MSKRIMHSLLIGISGCSFALIVFGMLHKSPALCDGCNVVVISLEALSPTSLSHMPLLARRMETAGIVFEHAYAAAPWPLPANAALLAGENPWEIGMLSTQSVLPQNVETVANRFSHYTYTTNAFVHGAYMDDAWNLDSGFDTWKEVSPPTCTQVPALRQAESWLTTHDAEDPFFIFIHPFGAQSLFSLGGSCSLPYDSLVRAHRGDMTAQTQLETAYKHFLATLDTEIDSFLTHIPPRTIVVVTGTYGELFTKRPEIGIQSQLPPLAELVHVPMIFFIPGHEPASISASVASKDIGTTLLTMVTPRTLFTQKDSLLPFIEKKETESRIVYSQTGVDSEPRLIAPPEVFSQTYAGLLSDLPGEGTAIPAQIIRSVILGPWQLIMFPDGTKELYDLASDPYTRKDVSATTLSGEDAFILGQLNSIILTQ